MKGLGEGPPVALGHLQMHEGPTSITLEQTWSVQPTVFLEAHECILISSLCAWGRRMGGALSSFEVLSEDSDWQIFLNRLERVT